MIVNDDLVPVVVLKKSTENFSLYRQSLSREVNSRPSEY
jgi:hypothetical protein